MHRLGGTRLVVVGVPPLGCMPLVKTIMGATTCAENYNKVAFSLNSKIQEKLETISTTSRMKTAFVDAYGIIQNVINNPALYGKFNFSAFFLYINIRKTEDLSFVKTGRFV